MEIVKMDLTLKSLLPVEPQDSLPPKIGKPGDQV